MRCLDLTFTNIVSLTLYHQYCITNIVSPILYHQHCITNIVSPALYHKHCITNIISQKTLYHYTKFISLSLYYIIISEQKKYITREFLLGDVPFHDVILDLLGSSIAMTIFFGFLGWKARESHCLIQKILVK